MNLALENLKRGNWYAVLWKPTPRVPEYTVSVVQFHALEVIESQLFELRLLVLWLRHTIDGPAVGYQSDEIEAIQAVDVAYREREPWHNSHYAVQWTMYPPLRAMFYGAYARQMNAGQMEATS